MKKTFLVLLVLTVFCFSACGQSLSGRYVADDEDSIIQYFEFTSSTSVRIGMGIMGITTSMTASYKIEGKSVIITHPTEGILELEIENNRTLVGVGMLIDDIEFIKE